MDNRKIPRKELDDCTLEWRIDMLKHRALRSKNLADKTCKFYIPETDNCRALTAPFCKLEKCKFYKRKEN